MVGLKFGILINIIASLRVDSLGFPGGAVVESLPANAGDTGSSPGLGGSHMPRDRKSTRLNSSHT